MAAMFPPLPQLDTISTYSSLIQKAQDQREQVRDRYGIIAKGFQDLAAQWSEKLNESTSSDNLDTLKATFWGQIDEYRGAVWLRTEVTRIRDLFIETIKQCKPAVLSADQLVELHKRGTNVAVIQADSEKLSEEIATLERNKDDLEVLLTEATTATTALKVPLNKLGKSIYSKDPSWGSTYFDSVQAPLSPYSFWGCKQAAAKPYFCETPEEREARYKRGADFPIVLPSATEAPAAPPQLATSYAQVATPADGKPDSKDN